ncbi:MAG TPA: response regulator [Gammaproteobacteria bacterium]|nr:response regulator [Gammaproteobacteria bacterium]
METVQDIIKILLVDDDLSVGEYLSLWIDRNNILDLELYFQSEAAKAIQDIKTIQPNLILLDYLMPEINGIELMEEINRVFGKGAYPIAFLSNYADQRQQALALGAVEFFTKAELSMHALTLKIRELAKNAPRQTPKTERLAITQEVISPEEYISDWLDLD